MQKGKKGTKGGSAANKSDRPISLKKLAEHLGLAPATVSLVINGSPVAETISADTKALILEAARKFNYRPNFFARALRTRSSFTVGVIVPEVSEGYNATVLSGIEDYLLQKGYFYFVASHRFRRDLTDEYVQLLLDRHIDGLVAINTEWNRELPLPVVTVSSHHAVKGVTSIVLDHNRAAELALRHLALLGHRNIAVIKGQAFVPDTEVRWKAISNVAAQMGLVLSPKLVAQIEDNSPSPHLGYKVTQKLLASGERFSALFAFNDISAIGASRALRDYGLRVPEDVSIVGFDDIESAAYQNPALTTVQQPLRKMGRMAGETLLRRISRPAEDESMPAVITVEPELVVRESTCAATREEKKTRGRATPLAKNSDYQIPRTAFTQD